jgi:hypothetical protein
MIHAACIIFASHITYILLLMVLIAVATYCQLTHRPPLYYSPTARVIYNLVLAIELLLIAYYW